MKKTHIASVIINTDPIIKAGEVFDGARLGKNLQKFINAGQIVAVKEKEVKKKEVK